MAVLVTGAAGFIGFHVSKALLARGEQVIGVDNLNDYYPPSLKRARLEQLAPDAGFAFHEADIADHDALCALLDGADVKTAIHLAAQAGVRYSIDNPFAYGRANLTGHLSVLELARRFEFDHLVYASSSSVYGANTETPFSEDHRTDAPVSLYGATKKADEALSESYARLYGLAQTGLRFFTVYGPWGRPDMAYWSFTENMLKGEPIKVFNHGKMARDFTYIDDIVDGVIAAHANPPTEAQGFHEIYNLGNDRPEDLMTMIGILEKELGVAAEKDMLGMQQGDVERTWADISKARRALGYDPKTSLEDGLARFVAWRKARPDGFR